MKAALARLGERVRNLREKRDLTQEATAELASLDPKHLQAVEAGKVNATVATLVGLARAFGIRLATLLRGV